MTHTRTNLINYSYDEWFWSIHTNICQTGSRQFLFVSDLDSRTTFRYSTDIWFDVIWQHRSGSTLVQVMVSCLTASSHYLNHCWILYSKILWKVDQANRLKMLWKTTSFCEYLLLINSVNCIVVHLTYNITLSSPSITDLAFDIKLQTQYAASFCGS